MLLLVDYQVADLESRCRNRVDIASAEAERTRAKLLVADAAPLWSPEAISVADDQMGLKVRSRFADYLHSLRVYIASNPAHVGVHLAIFVVSIISIALLGRYARAHSDGDPIMARVAEVLRHPIPAAFLVAILVDGAIHTNPPGAWTLLLNLLLLVPLLALVPRLVNPRLRAPAYILAAVYLIDAWLEVLPQHSFAGRLLKLGVKVTLIVTALWLMRWLYLPTGQAPGRERNLATVGLGAAGIDLNRFTLLAGALGVGIGFGLQNIVSNIVSGIIVLFERPVQIGDKVRIGTNDGEIRSIGLRATTIRTWEGAEVIVPNSRLVLDEVTNWTLSDQMRRIDVLVGVAYGSDTDRVTALLLQVAKDHEEVLEHPEPSVLFTGFGDSSLNFSVRAWTARFQDFLRVGSELTSAVNKAIAEAGITIPFPQRDVHMRDGNRETGPDSTGKVD